MTELTEQDKEVLDETKKEFAGGLNEKRSISIVFHNEIAEYIERKKRNE
jgi:hypothetical protein